LNESSKVHYLNTEVNFVRLLWGEASWLLWRRRRRPTSFVMLKRPRNVKRGASLMMWWEAFFTGVKSEPRTRCTLILSSSLFSIVKSSREGIPSLREHIKLAMRCHWEENPCREALVVVVGWCTLWDKTKNYDGRGILCSRRRITFLFSNRISVEKRKRLNSCLVLSQSLSRCSLILKWY
jgi:hypothetical protein